MHRDKIEDALSKALGQLEKAISITTANTSNEKALGDALWVASAETEYAVFLFALGQRERPEEASAKPDSATNQSRELEATLLLAMELLKNAKARVEEDNFKESYEAAWSARNLLLKAQEILEKRHREVRK